MPSKLLTFGLLLIILLCGDSVLALHDLQAQIEPQYISEKSTQTYNFTLRNKKIIGPLENSRKTSSRKKLSSDPIYRISLSALNNSEISIDLKASSCPKSWVKGINSSSQRLICLTDADPNNSAILFLGEIKKIKVKALFPKPQVDSKQLWKIKSKDNVWNSSTTKIRTILDVTPPKISINDFPDFINTDVLTISGEAKDHTTKVRQVNYRIDKSNWKELPISRNQVVHYSFKVDNSNLQDGLHTVYVKAVDQVNNKLRSENYAQQQFLLDTRPPTISDNASFGWQNKSSMLVGIKSKDPSPGSGTKWIKYCLDYSNSNSRDQSYLKNNLGCNPLQGKNYKGEPLLISKQGLTHLEYVSQDRAGNRQQIKTKVIKLDNEKPNSSIDLPPYTNKLTFDINYSVRENLSGIQELQLFYTKDGGKEWKRYGVYNYSSYQFQHQKPEKNKIYFTSPNNGTYGLYLIARDLAGNAEDPPKKGTSSQDLITIDTSAPRIINVSSQGQTYNVENLSLLRNKITFSENISKPPEVKVDGKSQQVNNCNDHNRKTFCFYYDLPSSNEISSTVTKIITINGAKDMAGNLMFSNYQNKSHLSGSKKKNQSKKKIQSHGSYKTYEFRIKSPPKEGNNFPIVGRFLNNLGNTKDIGLRNGNWLLGIAVFFILLLGFVLLNRRGNGGSSLQSL